MENLGIGIGLAALAFWGFVAASVVATFWDKIRKREAQHETVRRVIESGQHIDEALMDKLSMLTNDSRISRLDRDFRIAAVCIFPTSVGLFLFGLILGLDDAEMFYPIAGAAVLMACVGIGFWWASKSAAAWYVSDSTAKQLQD